MQYDYKTEHKQNVLFAIGKRCATLLLALLICAVIVYITNELLNGRLLESLKNSYVQLAVVIIIIVILICEIKSICSLYKYLDFQFSLRKLRMGATLQELQSCVRLYRKLKSGIDTTEMMIDVLKSLSPIPLAVLLLGFLIDKNKVTDLNWNIYTVVMIATVLIYIILLKHYLDNYNALKRKLLDIQDTQDAIRNKLLENDSKTHKINDHIQPVFKGF